MKVAAIIAEYNPFHNGHRYQIEETKKQTCADYILVVMSGNFVQRGAPAICNKYLRTQMALCEGADVVLELPSLYAVSSAEFFAGGSITLLNKLGMIDFLSFGSESGDIHALLDVSHFLAKENESYRKELSSCLKKGFSFPASRQEALLKCLSMPSAENLQELLSCPNNILGLEYCKYLHLLHSSIAPITLKRKGADYHDDTLHTLYSSATAIRSMLLSDTDKTQDMISLQNHIPLSCYQLLQNTPYFLDCNDFSLLLSYKLLSEKKAGFTKYLDCTPDISDKICKYLPEFKNYQEFCHLLKSKDLTYTRISRILLHILLNIETPDSFSLSIKERQLLTPYARLLGFRKEASPLLSSIKKNSEIPLIGNLADAKQYLDENALTMLSQDITVSHIYETVLASKYNREPLNEYRQSPIILSTYNT